MATTDSDAITSADEATTDPALERRVDLIKQRMLAVPEIAAWPEMADIVRSGKAKGTSIPCWEYPLLACRAMGGSEEQALPGMAATACMLNSIHLLDDMLDEDERGLYHTLGAGHVANIATAFQAVAPRMLDGLDLPGDRLAALHAAIARGGLATAYGQYLDASPLEGDPEENYWRVSLSKTPPLFGAAFYLGAVLGGADLEVASRIEGLGKSVGRMIQAGDDMSDALESPPNPDWRTRWNNLVILFALVAEHEERDRFEALLDSVDQPESLAEAQEILVRSGAISYGCYHVIQGYREGREALAALDLPAPEALGELFEELIAPARSLFESLDIEPPEELRTASP